MPDDKRAFYEFHASLMEPWDGPASVAFTDGTVVGAVLDRNGLRPSRYWVTDDGLVIMASEVGVLDIPPRQGRAEGSAPAREDVPRRHRAGPHRRRRRAQVHLRRGPAPTPSGSTPAWSTSRTSPTATTSRPSTVRSSAQQRSFGYTIEDQKILLGPMARTGAEPIGSMGTDTPVAVLSARSRLLFDYFQQLFAQVTNPPLDAIREELVDVAGVDHRTGGQPARRRAVELPADRAAHADPHQRPTGEDPLHQRRRRVPRLQALRRRRPLLRRRGRRGPAPGASSRSGPRCRRPSPTAPRSSCSATATPAPSWRRSRRCSSPRRCTTT